jgi:DNA-binding CsgD family transcriptional regulator
MTIRRVSREQQLQQGQLKVIDALYGAVADDTRWLDVTRSITDLFGAGATSLLIRNNSGVDPQRTTMTDVDSAFAQSYQHHYGAVNPWVAAVQGSRPEVYINGGDLDARPIKRSGCCRNWLRPLGDLRYSYNVSVQLDATGCIDLVGTRPCTSGSVDEQEQDLLRSFVPHLRRSGEMQSESCCNWLRPLGDLRYSYNVSVQLGATGSIDLLGTHPRKAGPIDEQEQDLLRSVVPHLRRAVELSHRLNMSELGRKSLDLTVQRLGTGVILVDAGRRVLFTDQEAESILSSGGLAVRHDQLRAPPSLDAELGEAIRRATGNGRTSIGRSGALFTVERPAGRLPLSVAIGPVDERDGSLALIGPLAMVLVTDPERGRHPSQEGLRALFDLTQAEAKLVVALCSGETLGSYAKATGTSLNTAKTHLKRVFDKTGETRQADLVRRVSNDVALRFGSDPSQ